MNTIKARCGDGRGAALEIELRPITAGPFTGWHRGVIVADGERLTRDLPIAVPLDPDASESEAAPIGVAACFGGDVATAIAWHLREALNEPAPTRRGRELQAYLRARAELDASGSPLVFVPFRARTAPAARSHLRLV